MLNSHTHCQVAPTDPQAKTWQRVWLFQPTTDRQLRRKKNTERTTAVIAEKKRSQHCTTKIEL